MFKQQIHHRKQVCVGVVNGKLREDGSCVTVCPAFSVEVLKNFLRFLSVGLQILNIT